MLTKYINVVFFGTLLYNHNNFVVRAEVFHGIIVALFIPSKVLCAASGRTRVLNTIGEL